jgi:hypothetical protein
VSAGVAYRPLPFIVNLRRGNVFVIEEILDGVDGYLASSSTVTVVARSERGE